MSNAAAIMRSTGREDEDDALFELRFAPTVTLVAKVRRFIGEFYGELLRDSDVSHSLAMATHEMLENAVSYSLDRRSELVIALHRISHEFVVTIVTKNRATGDRLHTVRAHLDEVVNSTNPSELYTQLMRRAVRRQDGGSGLGLGRIRAEADLSLSYIIEGDTLTVTAEGRFPCPMKTLPVVDP